MVSTVTITNPADSADVTTITCAASTSPAATLTTAFSVPSDCAFPIASAGAASSCGPLNWASYNYCNDNKFYSPAICPMGYSMYSLGTVEGMAGPAIRTSETAAICCPVSWSLADGSTVCAPSLGVTGSGTGYATVAEPIEIRWQSSDRSNLITPTAVYIAARASVTDGSTSSSRSGGEGGLSKGAKVGLGIGLGLGGFLILGVLAFFFLFWRRRKRDHSVREIYEPGMRGSGTLYSDPSTQFVKESTLPSTATLGHLHEGDDQVSEIMAEFPEPVRNIPKASMEAEIVNGTTHDDVEASK